MANQEHGLSIDRIDGGCEFDINDLKCGLCKNILWQPIACKYCEVAFCSACNNHALAQNAGVCPFNGDAFLQRECPRFILQQLVRLHFKCSYVSQGCPQVILYEDVEKHELECEYQPLECRGCHQTVLKKDHPAHEDACDEIELRCADCKLVYRRGDAVAVHSDIQCLREQLRALRHDFEENKQNTGEDIKQLKETAENLPGAIEKLENELEAHKNQTHEEIQNVQNSLDNHKQTIDDEISRLQQMFQADQEKSNGAADVLSKQFERTYEVNETV